MTPASNVSAAQTRGVKNTLPSGKASFDPDPASGGSGVSSGVSRHTRHQLGPSMAVRPAALAHGWRKKRRPPFGRLERPSNKKSANESSEVAVEECSRRGTWPAHEAAAHSFSKQKTAAPGWSAGSWESSRSRAPEGLIAINLVHCVTTATRIQLFCPVSRSSRLAWA